MEKPSLLQSFAIDKGMRVRSVDEVARGLACDCVCPECGEPVLARQGDVREWHFAHASGADCEGGAETALHRAAKQIVLENGGLSVPEMCAKATVELPDGRSATAEALRPHTWLDIDSAEAEKSIGKIRPDIVATVGNALLFVEIAVTHFVDSNKARTIDEMGVATLEINLADFQHTRWDWPQLTKAIIDDIANKQWIRVLDELTLRQEAHTKAMLAALSAPMPQEAPCVNLPAPRMRFRIQQRMVDVIERPFGLAVWSPYDPALNTVLSSLVRMLGGRWQPKFKNWLVPLNAKSHLLSALQDLSGTPPTQVG